MKFLKYLYRFSLTGDIYSTLIIYLLNSHCVTGRGPWAELTAESQSFLWRLVPIEDLISTFCETEVWRSEYTANSDRSFSIQPEVLESQ